MFISTRRRKSEAGLVLMTPIKITNQLIKTLFHRSETKAPPANVPINPHCLKLSSLKIQPKIGVYAIKLRADTCFKIDFYGSASRKLDKFLVKTLAK